MKYIADLHIHSHYSIATSKDLVPEHLDIWGRIKGITVVGTGDFTHPGWTEELQNKLEPAEPGLLQLKPDFRLDQGPILPGTSNGHVRFVLSAEISTIYKKGDKTRKVHHVILAPDFDTVARIQRSLGKIGNITSDGRPILGLDSRDLLEIALEANEDMVFIPAHIWTPWFSALGDKSGFNSIDECYGDLSGHIHAVETGLSSDPPMNWRCSFLDRFTIISNSDAHSPQKLGREANLLDTELSYPALAAAIQNGDPDRFLGTVEFFPEEGKYHHDGHRKCNISWDPQETAKHDSICPVCGKRVTVGVMNRVTQLADRTADQIRADRRPFHSMIPLKEILAEILGVGPNTKRVAAQYEELIRKSGSEFDVLLHQPISRVRETGGDMLAEAVERMRTGRVHVTAGYDGEFGVIKAFTDEERRRFSGQGTLFTDLAAPAKTRPEKLSHPKIQAGPLGKENGPARQASPPLPFTADDPLAILNQAQLQAVQHKTGPAMIIAGPGTGKTRVLTCRIFHLIKNLHIPPERILAVTFTNKAAQEMQTRLTEMLDAPSARGVTVCTFHALGYTMLQEQLDAQSVIIDEQDKERLLLKLGCKRQEIKEVMRAVTEAKQQLILPPQMTDARLGQVYWDYQNTLSDRGLLDLDDLIFRATRLLQENPQIALAYKERFAWVMVDEYQDVNYAQYQMIRTLCPDPNAKLCVIGDPNQAIYGFRGADVRFIQRFHEDWPDACEYTLQTSYRCPQSILEASQQVVKAQAGSLLAGLPSDVKLQMIEQGTDRSEAEFVARTIEQMIGGLRFFSIDSDVSDGQQRQGIDSLSNFAVLCRSAAQMAVLEKAFFDHSIPYQRVGQDPFFRQAPIASILNVIRFSLQPENTLLRERLEADPHLDLPEQAVCLSPSMPPAQAVGVVTDACPLKGEDQNALVKELLALCAEFTGTLQAFLRWTDLATGIDTYRNQTEQVALMTLHAAKGLEFPCVFIVGCEEGLLPYSLFTDRPSDPDEERRLLYVGMTRAQRFLYLSWAKSRVLYGKKRQFPRSPFLDIIEQELIEKSQARHSRRVKKQERQMMLFE